MKRIRAISILDKTTRPVWFRHNRYMKHSIHTQRCACFHKAMQTESQVRQMQADRERDQLGGRSALRRGPFCDCTTCPFIYSKGLWKAAHPALLPLWKAALLEGPVEGGVHRRACGTRCAHPVLEDDDATLALLKAAHPAPGAARVVAMQSRRGHPMAHVMSN